MQEQVVCNCAQISCTDIHGLLEIYPNLSAEQIKNILNIGICCGNCLRNPAYLTVEEVMKQTPKKINNASIF